MLAKKFRKAREGEGASLVEYALILLLIAIVVIAMLRGIGRNTYSALSVVNTTLDRGAPPPCFIATAAYGSYDDPHVRVLRVFRDRYLLGNPLGRAFVSYYYEFSPPIAAFIQRHETFRRATRWALIPIVFAIEYPLGFIFVIFGICSGAVLIYRKRNLNQFRFFTTVRFFRIGSLP